MNSNRNFLKRKSGQAIVEMGLVFIPLVLLLFGVIDVGWVMYRQITLGAATREGLRFAAINSFDSAVTDTGARDMIKDRIIHYGTGLKLQRSNINIAIDNSGAGGRPLVTISTNLKHQYIGGMLFLGQDDCNLNSTYRSVIATWTGNTVPRFAAD
jgi:Flp pilus assembly protein TadG